MIPLSKYEKEQNIKDSNFVELAIVGPSNGVKAKIYLDPKQMLLLANDLMDAAEHVLTGQTHPYPEEMKKIIESFGDDHPPVIFCHTCERILSRKEKEEYEK